MGWRAGNHVRLSRAWIEIGETARIDLMNAEKRDLSVSTIFADKRNYSRSFLRPEPIVSVLKEAGETNGLSNLATGMGSNVYSDLIGPRLPCLYAAVDNGDSIAAERAAERIAGCGVGLTPSSDDLLTGYLAVLNAMAELEGDEERKRVARCIADAAAQKTNRISGAFLTESGRGQISEDVLLLLKALFSNTDAERIGAAAKRVAAFGSTSGTDTLTGIVLAIIHHNGGKNSGQAGNQKECLF